MDLVGERISEFEGRNYLNWNKKVKKNEKKIEESIGWFWDRVKWFNIYVIDVLEWENREKELFEEVMVKIFLKLVNDNKLKI